MSEKKKPKTFDELYPGRFLKAGLFNGKQVLLTIKDVDHEELEGEDGKKTKVIVSFEETPLSLVACKTNGICLKAMFGPVVADWIGKRVTFFPDTWNGEPCIRIFGSPDIEQEFDAEVKLPRRKAKTMRMHKTQPRAERKAS